MNIKVDELGLLLAEIKKLNNRADALKAELKASGESAVDGQYYHASISRAERFTTDWHAIAEKFEPSRQLITAHTTGVEVVTLKLTSL